MEKSFENPENNSLHIHGLRHGETRRLQKEVSLEEADDLTGIKISTFQIKYPEFMKELKLKEDKVLQSAINTGYPIINHLTYYEALYNERI